MLAYLSRNFNPGDSEWIVRPSR